jgi:hypothetical protein
MTLKLLKPKPGYYYSPVSDQLAIIYPDNRVELIWRSEGSQHTRMTTYWFMRSIVAGWEYIGGL